MLGSTPGVMSIAVNRANKFASQRLYSSALRNLEMVLSTMNMYEFMFLI